ncbi:hypothetical protein DFJ67_2488 [Asanoa ferruginea]|uniref:Uncharacterized protein n=1 Tax=Asanoa ferruginea TaxID=53367 RepID=A0A3D9ZGH8_9ACTN|nr:hypothetical protein DFJ67_2488 [Asanoa ferruginea]
MRCGSLPRRREARLVCPGGLRAGRLMWSSRLRPCRVARLVWACRLRGGPLAGLVCASGLRCGRLAGLVWACRLRGGPLAGLVWRGGLRRGRLTRLVRSGGVRCGALARLLWAALRCGRKARLVRATGTRLRGRRRAAIHALLGRTAVPAGVSAELTGGQMMTRARLNRTRMTARGERRRWRGGWLHGLPGRPHRRRRVRSRSAGTRCGQTGPVDRRRCGRRRHPDRRRWRRHRGRARVLVVGPGLGVVRRPGLLAAAPLRGAVACRPVDPVRIVNHAGHPHIQRSLPSQA